MEVESATIDAGDGFGASTKSAKSSLCQMRNHQLTSGKHLPSSGLADPDDWEPNTFLKTPAMVESETGWVEGKGGGKN